MSTIDYLTPGSFRAQQWREDLERLSEDLHQLAARLARAVPDFDPDADQAEQDAHADAYYLAEIAAELSGELKHLVRVVAP